MSKELHLKLQPQNQERNQRIAAILTLLLTLAHKIENIKQKLCGFSSRDFSPQCVFQALDLTNKGYLDMHDVKEFVGNERIQDDDIIRLFMKMGATSADPKLTYLSYLNLLKPHFDNQLGRDLLMRDTVRKSQTETRRQTQQTVLMLLNELLLLNCICIAEHQQMKNALIDQYMLNPYELKEILGLSATSSALKAIFEFIDCNSTFEVEPEQMKYLLAYLRISEYELTEDYVLSYLFVPVRLNMEEVYKKKSREGAYGYVDRQRQKMHMNYDKKYLSKADLSATVQKLSFLNYIHPNSYQHKPPTRDIPQKQKKANENTYRPEESIAKEHQGLQIYNDRNLKNSYNEMKQRPVLETSKVDQMIINRSQINRSQVPQVPLKLVNSQIPIDTPMLEQFMRDSNIRENMGEYRPRPQQPKINVLLEESAFSRLSDSQAFVRIPPNTLGVPANRPKQESRVKPAPMDRSLQSSKWRPKGVQVFTSKVGNNSSYGILDQFLRNDV